LVSDTDVPQPMKPVRTPGPVTEELLFRRLTIASGLLAAGIAIAGILAAFFGIALARGANPEYRTIALSAALIWIILGTTLAYQAVKTPVRITRLVVQSLLILIAGGSAIEFVYSIRGSHFFIENFFVRMGTAFLGPSSSPISPAAAGLSVAAALALIFLIRSPGTSGAPARTRNAVSITGLALSLVSITFVLSYTYGNPLLYGTGFMPMALISALAALFTGVSLMTAAGPCAVPARYFAGSSTGARLLRVFVPLVAAFILAENLIFVLLSSWFSIRDAVLLSAILVVFVSATALVVARVSGGIGRALDEAEQELAWKNEELGNLNEELMASDEELRRNVEELGNLNEELTAADEELRQNIDELTRAEMALRESEERFKSVLDNSPDVLYRYNLQKRHYDYFSPACLAVFGYSPEEMIAMDERGIWDHVHPDDLRKFEEEMAGIQATGGGETEIRWKTRSGGYIWLSVSIHMTTGNDGRPVYRYGFVRDITKRRTAEQALAVTVKENTFLADLLNRSEQPFGVGYTDGRLGVINPAFERLTGYSADELRTMDWAKVLTPPEWREPEQKSLDELNRTGLPVRYEKEYARKDGSRVPIELLVHLVKDGSGNPLHYYSFITDITERKRWDEALLNRNENLNALNEELRATQEELHRNLEELSLREEDLSKALAEKEVLLSEIHHRVKNNLTAFISLLSLEGSTEDTPAGKMLRQDLQNRARSMALVHETLYRTRLFHDVDMEMYLSTLLNQIAGSFGTTRAVKIVVDAHGVMLDIPRATPAGLIVNEIVTNSFKYAFPDSFDVQQNRNAPPTISVTLTKTKDEYEMIIRDNGVGLPPGIDLTRTKSLGLKLVNFLAKHQMRADVEVISESGTAFIFRFSD
jgi:PAS domain S-box-containing protein